MEDNKLDKIIKDLMGEYSEDYDPQSWESLSERLDAPASPDAEGPEVNELFDEEVRSAIEDFEEPYQATSWPVLLSKMQEADAFELKVVATKSMEGILFILLLITAFRFIPELAPVMPYNTADHIASSEAANHDADQLDISEHSSAVIDPDQGQVQEKGFQAAQSNGSDGMEPFSGRQSARNSSDQQQPNAVYASIQRKVEPLEGKPLNSIDQTNSQAGLTLVSSEIEFHRSSEMLPVVEQMPIKKEERIWLKGIKPATSKGWYIGAFAATDFNHILTPYDQVYKKDAYDQYRVGYGGGISLQYGGKRFRVETGFDYSSKHYAPKKIVEIFVGERQNEYYSVSLENIELNTLSIPLNAHLTTNPNSKWQFYVLGGITMNLVVEADYDKQEQAIYAFSIPDEGPNTEVSYSRAARIEQKDFKKGLFQGGSFRDNNFITFNVGGGLERILNNSWSVYLQPTYQSNFFSTGLGPNNDRIHIFSLFLGARKKLY